MRQYARRMKAKREREQLLKQRQEVLSEHINPICDQTTESTNTSMQI